MAMLNCTRETKLATIFYIAASKNKQILRKAVPITVEQLDKIPEIAEALKIYNDESLKKEVRVEAMRFISSRVQNFLYLAIYSESNSVQLCSQFLGLPDYAELDSIIENQLQLEKAA